MIGFLEVDDIIENLMFPKLFYSILIMGAVIFIIYRIYDWYVLTNLSKWNTYQIMNFPLLYPKILYPKKDKKVKNLIQITEKRIVKIKKLISLYKFVSVVTIPIIIIALFMIFFFIDSFKEQMLFFELAILFLFYLVLGYFDLHFRKRLYYNIFKRVKQFNDIK